MIRQITSIALSALALAALTGCGQGADNNAGSELTPVPPKPLAAGEPAAAPVAPAPVTPPAAPAPAQVAAAAQQDVAPVPPKPRYTLASDNFLKNGGFEQAADEGRPAFWVVPDAVPDVSLSDAGSYAGEKSIEIELDAGTDCGIWQALPVTAGATYRLSGYVKTKGVTDGVWLEVQDAEKGHKNFAMRTSAKPVLSDEWSRQSVDFTVPGGVKVINVMLRRPILGDSENTEDGTVWFDGVALHAIKEVTTASLLASGNFEDKTNPLKDWSTPADEVEVSASDDAVKGEASVKIEIPKDTDLGIRSVVAVEPGKTYVLTGHIKTDGLAANARLEVSDALEGHEKFVAFNEGLSGSNGWTEMALVFTVPDGTTGINVVLRVVNHQGGGLGYVWFDGYELYPLS